MMHTVAKLHRSAWARLLQLPPRAGWYTIRRSLCSGARSILCLRGSFYKHVLQVLSTSNRSELWMLQKQCGVAATGRQSYSPRPRICSCFGFLVRFLQGHWQRWQRVVGPSRAPAWLSALGCRIATWLRPGWCSTTAANAANASLRTTSGFLLLQVKRFQVNRFPRKLLAPSSDALCY